MKQNLPDWQIEFFSTPDGSCPVLDFLSSLTKEERAKIRNHLRLLKEFGIQLGMPQARPLKGHKPLWELRPMPNRLIYVAVSGRRFVIVHGFKKKSQKTPLKEIKIAEKRYKQISSKES